MAIADLITTPGSIDSYVNLTLTLSSDTWADAANGASFYVLMEIAEPSEIIPE